MQSGRVRWFAEGLAALAGFVDVVGFLTVGGYFVSFMSDNSTRLAIGSISSSLEALMPTGLIASFVLGVMVGELCARRKEEQRTRRVLLLVTGLLAFASVCAIVGLSSSEGLMTALAMGAMNTVFSYARRLPVGMTYMTGALVALRRACVSIDAEERKNARYFLTHWIALVVGGIAAALTHRALGANTLLIAVAGSLALLLSQPKPNHRL